MGMTLVSQSCAGDVLIARSQGAVHNIPFVLEGRALLLLTETEIRGIYFHSRLTFTKHVRESPGNYPAFEILPTY